MNRNPFFPTDSQRADRLDEDSSSLSGHRQPLRRHRKANRKGSGNGSDRKPRKPETEILRKLCFGQLMTFTNSPIAYVEKMAFLTQNTARLFKIVCHMGF
jgi:hypothetical protein